MAGEVDGAFVGGEDEGESPSKPARLSFKLSGGLETAEGVAVVGEDTVTLLVAGFALATRGAVLVAAPVLVTPADDTRDGLLAPVMAGGDWDGERDAISPVPDTLSFASNRWRKARFSDSSCEILRRASSRSFFRRMYSRIGRTFVSLVDDGGEADADTLVEEIDAFVIPAEEARGFITEVDDRLDEVADGVVRVVVEVSFTLDDFEVGEISSATMSLVSESMLVVEEVRFTAGLTVEGREIGLRVAVADETREGG